MIHVEAVYGEAGFEKLSITDHADDSLVCAGVSSCYVGALNALDDLDAYQIENRSGDSYVVRIGRITGHDETVLETLVIQLKTIEQSYPDDVRVHVSGRKDLNEINL